MPRATEYINYSAEQFQSRHNEILKSCTYLGVASLFTTSLCAASLLTTFFVVSLLNTFLHAASLVTSSLRATSFLTSSLYASSLATYWPYHNLHYDSLRSQTFHHLLEHYVLPHSSSPLLSLPYYSKPPGGLIRRLNLQHVSSCLSHSPPHWALRLLYLLSTSQGAESLLPTSPCPIRCYNPHQVFSWCVTPHQVL